MRKRVPIVIVACTASQHRVENVKVAPCWFGLRMAEFQSLRGKGSFLLAKLLGDEILPLLRLVICCRKKTN